MSTVLVGADERKAVQAFSVKFPKVPKEDILSIAPVEYTCDRYRQLIADWQSSGSEQLARHAQLIRRSFNP